MRQYPRGHTREEEKGALVEEKRDSRVMSDWPPADGPPLRHLSVGQKFRLQSEFADKLRPVPHGPNRVG
jgi:hypothetical protein